MVSCRLYSAQAKKSWDQFVESCKTPLFFFKRDYMEYHADRFVDASLMFYRNEQLVAIFPATKQGTLLNSHAGLSFGGLLLSEKLRSETLLSVVSCLAKQAWEMGYSKIIYKAIPYLFYTQGSQEDLYAISNSLEAKLFRRDLSSVIYLDKRLKLSKGRKWLIARAKKLGLEIKESEDWFNFHRLLSTALARHEVKPVHSVAELRFLATLFTDKIQLKTIEKNGILLAAALLFKFPNTVHTQYLATSEEGKAVGALDLLIETCILDAKHSGYPYFSFGISTEEQGKVLNKGLVAQKESFGARGLVLDFYEINLNG